MLVAPNPTRRHRLSRSSAIVGLLVAVCAVVLAPRASGGSFVVLRSGEEAPYKAASARIIDRIRKSGSAAVEASLADWNAAALKDVEGVVAVGTEAAQRAQSDAPAGIPIVFCMVADPQGAGLEDDARSTRGVLMEPAPIEQLTLLRRSLPKAKSVGVLYSSASPSSVALLEEARNAAPPGLSFEAVDAAAHANASDAIDALLARSPDCVWTRPDPAVYDSAVVRAVLLASLRKSTPVFGYSAAVVRAGAVVGVAVSPEDQGEAAAMMALRKTPDDRTMAPTNWEVAINLEVADRLGIELPAEVMRSAKVVFKKQ